MSAGADDYLTKPVDAFAVQARLVAAERVTSLHSKLAATQGRARAGEHSTFWSSRGPTSSPASGNRRRMEEDLARVHARAVRVDRSYGVALFDIDHFKLYNDHYGHIAGDEALRQIAARIELVVRASDCCYRFGGEEFLLLVQDCDFVNSLFAAGERVRQAVVDAGIPHEARPSDPPVATVSGGVAAWTPGSTRHGPRRHRVGRRGAVPGQGPGRNRIQVARSALLGPEVVPAGR